MHSRRNQRGGYLTSEQWFNPSQLQRATGPFDGAAPSAAPSGNWIRPPLLSTFHTGGARGKRSMRGGFSPIIMGGFIPNAQASIVPAALYSAYRTLSKKRKSVASRAKKLYKSLTRRRTRRMR